MKFRAKMTDPLSMKNLALMASVVGKLSKQCTLRLNPQHFTLMVSDEHSSPKQVVVWCVVEAQKFFGDYSLEGVTPTLNEIFLLVPPDMLSTSLSTLKTANNNARSVKLKLTDKMTPCLTVEIELSTEYGMTRSCIHDIPVKIISRQAWSDYTDPPQEHSDAVLEIKTLKKLRAVLEKCRKLSPWVSLSVTSGGTLSTSVTSSTATVTTLFKNTSATYSSDENQGRDHIVRTDIKRLCTLLSSEVLAPKRALVHFIESRRITFYLACESFAFHFFLPGVEE